MRLGDLDALKEALISETRDKFEFVCLSRVIEKIDNAPTVAVNCKDCDGYEAGYSAGLKDAERTQSEWIIVKDEKYGDNVKCPFCGKELAGTDLNFCCKCGAKLTGSEKMNGGKEE